MVCLWLKSNCTAVSYDTATAFGSQIHQSCTGCLLARHRSWGWGAGISYQDLHWIITLSYSETQRQHAGRLTCLLLQWQKWDTAIWPPAPKVPGIEWVPTPVSYEDINDARIQQVLGKLEDCSEYDGRTQKLHFLIKFIFSSTSL